jgi:hypothetical protein
MLQRENTVLFLTEPFYMKNSVTLTPLSLQISYKLPLPTVGLKIHSVPTFSLKSTLTKFAYATSGIDRLRGLVPSKSDPLYSHVYTRCIHIQYNNITPMKNEI